jgi:hypothetical protein
MIMPNKYLTERDALIGVGSILLGKLSVPKKLSNLWEEVKDVPSIGVFDRLAYGLELLFVLGLIELKDDKIERLKLIEKTTHDLKNKTWLMRKKIEIYEESLENGVDLTHVDLVYEEAGIVFAKSIKKTLVEARVFHSQITKNRSSFLQTEIDQIKKQLVVYEKH